MKRFALALCVTTVFGSMQSVYAKGHHDIEGQRKGVVRSVPLTKPANDMQLNTFGASTTLQVSQKDLAKRSKALQKILRKEEKAKRKLARKLSKLSRKRYRRELKRMRKMNKLAAKIEKRLAKQLRKRNARALKNLRKLGISSLPQVVEQTIAPVQVQPVRAVPALRPVAEPIADHGAAPFRVPVIASVADHDPVVDPVADLGRGPVIAPVADLDPVENPEEDPKEDPKEGLGFDKKPEAVAGHEEDREKDSEDKENLESEETSEKKAPNESMLDDEELKDKLKKIPGLDDSEIGSEEILKLLKLQAFYNESEEVDQDENTFLSLSSDAQTHSISIDIESAEDLYSRLEQDEVSEDFLSPENFENFADAWDFTGSAERKLNLLDSADTDEYSIRAIDLKAQLMTVGQKMYTAIAKHVDELKTYIRPFTYDFISVDEAKNKLSKKDTLFNIENIIQIINLKVNDFNEIIDPLVVVLNDSSLLNEFPNIEELTLEVSEMRSIADQALERLEFLKQHYLEKIKSKLKKEKEEKDKKDEKEDKESPTPTLEDKDEKEDKESPTSALEEKDDKEDKGTSTSIPEVKQEKSKTDFVAVTKPSRLDILEMQSTLEEAQKRIPELKGLEGLDFSYIPTWYSLTLSQLKEIVASNQDSLTEFKSTVESLSSDFSLEQLSQLLTISASILATPDLNIENLHQLKMRLGWIRDDLGMVKVGPIEANQVLKDPEESLALTRSSGKSLEEEGSPRSTSPKTSRLEVDAEQVQEVIASAEEMLLSLKQYRESALLLEDDRSFLATWHRSLYIEFDKLINSSTALECFKLSLIPLRVMGDETFSFEKLANLLLLGKELLNEASLKDGNYYNMRQRVRLVNGRLAKLTEQAEQEKPRPSSNLGKTKKPESSVKFEVYRDPTSSDAPKSTKPTSGKKGGLSLHNPNVPSRKPTVEDTKRRERQVLGQRDAHSTLHE